MQALFAAFAVDEANHVAMMRARLGEKTAGVMPQVRPPRRLDHAGDRLCPHRVHAYDTPLQRHS